MSKLQFQSRIEFALRYLTFDAITRDENWGETAGLFLENQEYGLPELMVLIHPRHLSRLGLSSTTVFGPDSFSAAKFQVTCRSNEIWGYSCPFTRAKIHIDHSFPRSRGGATHSLNAMYLCEEHNLPKSSDIHLFPWESLPSRMSWVDPIIEKMNQAEKRISGLDFHFPKLRKQL